VALDEILKAVAQLGFPIFVAAYLLIRMETLVNRLIELTLSQHELLRQIREELRELVKSNGGHRKE